MISQTIALINSRMDLFTSSEQKIAEFIISQPEEVTGLTVSELANKCSVSEATVVRFVKKLKFDSFQDFKLSLALDNFTSEKNIDTDINIKDNDTPEIIKNKVEAGFIRTIQSTSSIFNTEELVKAVNFIRGAKRREIYGVASSAAVAQVLQYKLTRLGFPAYTIEDPHSQAISAATMMPGDLVIGISQSGSTKDIVDSVAVAKKHGATVICITDHSMSPIVQYADCVLETYSRENPVKTGAGRSILAQIFVVELLTAQLSVIEPEKAKQAGSETAKAVANKLY